MKSMTGPRRNNCNCLGLGVRVTLSVLALTLTCVLPMTKAEQATARRDTVGASFKPFAGQAKYQIPKGNLQIPEDLKGCAENLRKIHAALGKYEKDKGKIPDWLSELIPDYLGAETLFCPDDPRHRSGYWPDPKLPCSYCYELSPSRVRAVLGGTMRKYKVLQRGLFGDVVPVARCFHHRRVLNLAWDGQIYTSPEYFENLFIPDYRADMLFAVEKPNPEPKPIEKPQPKPAELPTKPPEPAAEKAEILAFDDFDGKLGLKWEIVNPNASNYSLSKKPGSLTITTKKGHFSKSNTNYENVFLIDRPASEGQDFQVTTCIASFIPEALWNQAGIVCWEDEDN